MAKHKKSAPAKRAAAEPEQEPPAASRGSTFGIAVSFKRKSRLGQCTFRNTTVCIWGTTRIHSTARRAGGRYHPSHTDALGPPPHTHTHTRKSRFPALGSQFQYYGRCATAVAHIRGDGVGGERERKYRA